MAALDVPNEENFAHYADVIEKDPNLKDVTSLEELHTKLAELSQTCLNENSSVFSQLTFDGVNPNPAFQPNLFKKDIGCDGRKITSYYRYAIKNEEHVVAALEYACDSTPSLLIPASSDGNIGALYQGGFKAVGNLKFLQEHKVTYIVNTARDLGAFFPKFNKYVSSARGIGVEFLELDWVDDREQIISKEDLQRAVLFIHQARVQGHSVLVHCAQGRSRSGTISAAYVATVLGTPFLKADLQSQDTINDALRVIKEGRRMAQPNSNFEAQLRNHTKDGVFNEIRAQL